MADYLLMHTRADAGAISCERHPMTITILETVAGLQYVNGSQTRHDVDYLQGACLAIARHNGSRSWHDGRLCSSPEKVFSRSWGLDQILPNILALAAHLGIVPIVELLVEEGVPDTETPFGYPIQNAAAHPDPEITRAYLRAKLKRRERHGSSLMSIKPIREQGQLTGYATTKPHRGISGRAYHSAICEAVCCGTLQSVQSLIIAAIADDELCPYRCWPVIWPKQKRGSNLLVRKFTIVLLLAVRNNRPTQFAQYALDNGADPDGTIETGYSFSGITILQLAARNGSKSMFDLLLKNGADVFHTYRKEVVSSLVARAVFGGHVEIVKTCLDAMVPIRFPGRLLFTTIRRRHPDVLQLLIRRGIAFEPGSKDDNDITNMLERVRDDRMTAMIESLRNSLKLNDTRDVKQ